jgi:amino acid adenylation domain-containing protein
MVPSADPGLVATNFLVGAKPSDEGCVVHRLRAIAASCPDSVAVRDEEMTLTYAQLMSWADELSVSLTNRGIRRADRVAVAGTRSAYTIAALVAVLSAGATYVPLDPEYPQERLNFMLADSGATMLLHHSLAEGQQLPFLPDGVHEMEVPPPAADVSVAEPLAFSCEAALPVYAIYTSGSTGWPKGVLLPHSCIDNMVSWQIHASVPEAAVTAQFAPMNFDVFFQEVLGTLCSGGQVVVMPERFRRDSFRFLAWLEEHTIQRLFVPYSALQMLAAAAEAKPRDLALKEINCAGEPLVCTAAIKQFFRSLTECRLSNHYGQSESAMVSWYVLGSDPDSWPVVAPIGAPLPGCTTIVHPQEDSADPNFGELLVAGLPVSLGYINNDELNERRFVDVVLPSGDTVRAFRTHDLVKRVGAWLECAGRIDDDVKVRGYRVSLGEIEAWLCAQGGVIEAAVVVLSTTTGSRSLRAAIVVDGGDRHIDTNQIKQNLRTALPEYSVPASIVVLPSLPRSPSGKLDRSKIGSMISEVVKRA